MRIKKYSIAIVLFSLTIISAGCNVQSSSSSPTVENTKPHWFSIPLVDVKTGESFTMNDFSGKVVLVETMAIWCPNCIIQAHEVQKLHELMDNPGNLVSVSLDIDVNEEAPGLKDYVNLYGFDWYYAIAPLEMARALGNLYGANYLNPPLSPMLIIERTGEVHKLEHGKKSAEMLLDYITPYLIP